MWSGDGNAAHSFASTIQEKIDIPIDNEDASCYHQNMNSAPKTTKKITLATVKSFITRNLKDLHQQTLSRFDGMTDCVEQNRNAAIVPANTEKFKADDKSQMGIPGVWFVGDSRDYFTVINTPEWFGYEVYNCCGSWQVLVPANSQAASRERVRLGVN